MSAKTENCKWKAGCQNPAYSCLTSCEEYEAFPVNSQKQDFACEIVRVTCLDCRGSRPTVTVLPDGRMTIPEEKPPCPTCRGRGFIPVNKAEYDRQVREGAEDRDTWAYKALFRTQAKLADALEDAAKMSGACMTANETNARRGERIKQLEAELEEVTKERNRLRDEVQRALGGHYRPGESLHETVVSMREFLDTVHQERDEAQTALAASQAECERLRELFDVTRNRVLASMKVDDKGHGWAWIESELATREVK